MQIIMLIICCPTVGSVWHVEIAVLESSWAIILFDENEKNKFRDKLWLNDCINLKQTTHYAPV